MLIWPLYSTAGKVANTATTATNLNTPSTIVARDINGDFSANMITSNLTGNVTGNASNVTGVVSPVKWRYRYSK